MLQGFNAIVIGQTCVPFPEPGPPRTKTIMRSVFCCVVLLAGSDTPGCKSDSTLIINYLHSVNQMETNADGRMS